MLAALRRHVPERDAENRGRWRPVAVAPAGRLFHSQGIPFVELSIWCDRRDIDLALW